VEDRFIHRSSPGVVVRRDLVRHPGAVVILPFLDARTLLILRQFRWAAKGDLWEIPAGTLEKREAGHESPLRCAKRELEEETGFKARRWTYLTRFYPAPGISDEIMWLYRAEGLVPGRMSPESDEWIKVVPMPVSRILAMIRAGRIRDGKTLLGVLWAVSHATAGRRR
jgi:ADP-ribose pyrophosphatase